VQELRAALSRLSAESWARLLRKLSQFPPVVLRDATTAFVQAKGRKSVAGLLDTAQTATDDYEKRRRSFGITHKTIKRRRLPAR
jgi:hypothetical protein